MNILVAVIALLIHGGNGKQLHNKLPRAPKLRADNVPWSKGAKSNMTGSYLGFYSRPVLPPIVPSSSSSSSQHPTVNMTMVQDRLSHNSWKIPQKLTINYTVGTNHSSIHDTPSCEDFVTFKPMEKVNQRELTIIALSKETKNLQHWLFYHFLLGFSKVFIVSNDCQQRKFDKLVEDVKHSYVPKHFVEIISDARCLNPIPQSRVYNWVGQCIQQTWREKLPKHTEVRTAFIDTDEYINVKHGINFHDVLNGDPINEKISEALYPDKPQWSVGWRSFGTSFLEEEPKGGTFFTSFIMRVPLFCDKHGRPLEDVTWAEKTNIRQCNLRYDGEKKKYSSMPYFQKAICDADFVGLETQNTAHYCYDPGSKSALWKRTQSVDINKVWINHYILRSKREWLEKLKRGRANRNGKATNVNVTSLFDYFSEVVDLSMIEQVHVICKRNFKVLKDDDKSFDKGGYDCCIHTLLGARGTGNLYANQTKMKLLNFCGKDSKVGDYREYKASCDFLLGKYEYETFKTNIKRCDLMFEKDKELLATTATNIIVDRKPPEYNTTCSGTCGLLKLDMLTYDIFHEIPLWQRVNMTNFTMMDQET